MGIKEEIYSVSGGRIREIFEKTDSAFFENAEEIRLREGQSIKIIMKNKAVFIGGNGKPSKEGSDAAISAEDLKIMVSFMSGYSPYAYKELISSGFMSIPGGHRAGIAGHAVILDGKVDMVKDISSLNIRIAHEKKGCAEGILKYITGGGKIKNTAVVSPPGFGKTTVLRDLIRSISNRGTNVSLVDERSEIAAVFRGKAQCDIGKNTDVLDGFPKAEGMLMALRSLSPQIIACDEIGGERDIEAVKEISVCGVGLLCTVHGRTMAEVRNRLNTGADEFDIFVFLKKNEKGGRYACVYDRAEKLLGEEELNDN